MRSRFGRYGFIASLAAILIGCGAAGNAKTPAGETKKDVAVEQKKADEAAAKTDKPAEPRDEFFLPNVDFAAPANMKKVTLAGKELSVEACKFDKSGLEIKHEGFAKAIQDFAVAPDGAMYILDHDAKVRKYVAQPGDTCKLALDPAFGEQGILTLPEEPKRITVTDDGTFVALRFSQTYRYKGGKLETLECGGEALSPDGRIIYKKRIEEVRLVEIASQCKETPWNYTGWAMKPLKGNKPELVEIQTVHRWGNDLMMHMMIGGQHYAGIHGLADGKLKTRFGKDDARDKDVKEGEEICWLADSDPCTAGVCVLDSNCKRLTAFDVQGKFVQMVSLGDLLGLPSPWPVALATTPKGFSYLAITHKEKLPEGASRPKKDSYAALIFRVKGLN